MVIRKTGALWHDMDSTRYIQTRFRHSLELLKRDFSSFLANLSVPSFRSSVDIKSCVLFRPTSPPRLSDFFYSLASPFRVPSPRVFLYIISSCLIPALIPAPIPALPPQETHAIPAHRGKTSPPPSEAEGSPRREEENAKTNRKKKGKRVRFLTKKGKKHNGEPIASAVMPNIPFPSTSKSGNILNSVFPMYFPLIRLTIPPLTEGTRVHVCSAFFFLDVIWREIERKKILDHVQGTYVCKKMVTYSIHTSAVIIASCCRQIQIVRGPRMDFYFPGSLALVQTLELGEILTSPPPSPQGIFQQRVWKTSHF